MNIRRSIIKPQKKVEQTQLLPEVKDFFNSFFSYWEKCEETLRNKVKIHPDLTGA